MFDEAVVEMESGSIVRLPELSARLTVGERGPVRRTYLASATMLIHSFLVEHSSPSDPRDAEHYRLPPRQRETKQPGHRSVCKADRSCHCLARNQSIRKHRHLRLRARTLTGGPQLSP